MGQGIYDSHYGRVFVAPTTTQTTYLTTTVYSVPTDGSGAFTALATFIPQFQGPWSMGNDGGHIGMAHDSAGACHLEFRNPAFQVLKTVADPQCQTVYFLRNAVAEDVVMRRPH